MNKTTLNSQKEKHSMLSLRRATSVALPGLRLHLDFYPRSPCGERQLILPVKFTAWAFLSTLSLRRATGNDRRGCWYSCYFYPRSPYGERRMSRCTVAGSCRFLSTLSLRRATTKHDQATNTHRISIHALLTESDRPSAMLSSGREYFYPRSPYGERRIILRNRLSLSADFYPRSPYGERRSRSFLSMSKVWISIHALLTESDREWRGHQRQW